MTCTKPNILSKSMNIEKMLKTCKIADVVHFVKKIKTFLKHFLPFPYSLAWKLGTQFSTSRADFFFSSLLFSQFLARVKSNLGIRPRVMGTMRWQLQSTTKSSLEYISLSKMYFYLMTLSLPAYYKMFSHNVLIVYCSDSQPRVCKQFTGGPKIVIF